MRSDHGENSVRNRMAATAALADFHRGTGSTDVFSKEEPVSPRVPAGVGPMAEEPRSENRAAAVSPPPHVRPPAARDTVRDPIMAARAVNVHYGDKHAVRTVSLDMGRNQVLAMIGPSASRRSCAV